MKRREGMLDIVCISPAPWDYPIWTNRQHIMERLARRHRVVYVFHPYFLRSATKRNISLNRVKLISMQEKIDDNLSTFTPFVAPFSNRILCLHRINVKISSMFLKKALKRLTFEDYILWFYDPEGAFYLDYLKPILSCYDCVDEYSTMPYYNSEKRKERLRQLESRLLEECDIVFTTSVRLYEKKRLVNPNTFLVENVGDFEHFNKAATQSGNVPTDFPDEKRPVIGFVGALDNYKVDFELIDYLALRRPDWSIVLIGGRLNPEEKGFSLPKRDNVYYLGRKPYKALPDYIANFDACIIPYKINDYTEHVFPIKLFEYLATGKPVITTALPSVRKYESTVKIADTYKSFMLAVEEAISHHSGKLIERRINLAKRNTWESRADKLLSHIYNKLGAR